MLLFQDISQSLILFTGDLEIWVSKLLRNLITTRDAEDQEHLNIPTNYLNTDSF